MTPEELRRLENVFIKLKGDGKSFDEIAKSLSGVATDLLKKWDSEYENALANYKESSPSPIEVSISEKDESGKYIFQNTLSFQLSTLEKIRFDLSQAFSVDVEKLPNATPERITLFKSLANEAKVHHKTFGDYFIDITIHTADDIQNYSVTYHLNNNDPDVKAKAEEAIQFYLRNIFYYDELKRKSVIIKANSVDSYGNTADILPYSLKQFHFINYQGIIETSIDNIPIDTKWIFITGENGYGKTSILQSLLIGLFGTKDNERDLIAGSECQIAVEYKNKNQNVINHIRGFGFTSIKNIVSYGPSRLQIQNAQTKNEVAQKSSLTYSLFNPDGVLLNIEYNLLIWKLAGDKKFSYVRDIFLKLIPQLSDIQVNEEKEIVYVEREPEPDGEEYIPLTFEKLASGFRSIIAMIGDMIIRFYQYDPYILNPSEFSGIAIIDELDLHWHPKLQKQLPQLFSTAFPLIQFIVTTHSVIPFLGAPRNSVFLKVKRTKENGVQVEHLDIDIKNLLPNILLTSSLFDMESVKQINNENIEEVRTENSAEEMNETDDIDKRLKAFEDSNEDFPNNLFT